MLTRLRYVSAFQRSVVELKTFSALAPFAVSANSSITQRSSRGAHFNGFVIFLIVEADPSNFLIFLYYCYIVFSSSGAFMELYDTNCSAGDLFLVMSIVGSYYPGPNLSFACVPKMSSNSFFSFIFLMLTCMSEFGSTVMPVLILAFVCSGD